MRFERSSRCRGGSDLRAEVRHRDQNHTKEMRYNAARSSTVNHMAHSNIKTIRVRIRKLMVKRDVTAWLSEEISEKSMNPRLQISKVDPLILAG